MSLNPVYCNLTTISVAYRHWHGYLSVLVCVLGSVANILNICVLTSREMRWPTNYILTGLAVADLLVMLEYIPFAGHVYLNADARRTAAYFSYRWAVFMLFHAIFTQVCHFISCCLTVILAIWRYVAITQSPRNSKLTETVRNLSRTILAIFLTYLWCPLICLPIFMSLNIVSHTKALDASDNIMRAGQLANHTGVKTHNGSIFLIEISGHFRVPSFVIYSIFIKLLPCVLLTWLSIRIIAVLLETKRRRKMLLVNNLAVPRVETNVLLGGKVRGTKSEKVLRNEAKEQQTDRTTRMLLAVLLLFLLTELPQALLGLLTVLVGELFERECFIPLGEILDMLALTNSAINFILYCTMSRQFRTTFVQLLRPKIFGKWSQLTDSVRRREQDQGSRHIAPGSITTQVTVV